MVADRSRPRMRAFADGSWGPPTCRRTGSRSIGSGSRSLTGLRGPARRSLPHLRSFGPCGLSRRCAAGRRRSPLRGAFGLAGQSPPRCRTSSFAPQCPADRARPPGRRPSRPPSSSASRVLGATLRLGFCARRRRWEFHAGASGFREADGNRLLCRSRAVFPSADVTDLLPDERACLGRRRSSGTFGLASAFQRGLLSHRNPPEPKPRRNTDATNVDGRLITSAVMCRVRGEARRQSPAPDEVFVLMPPTTTTSGRAWTAVCKTAQSISSPVLLVPVFEGEECDDETGSRRDDPGSSVLYAAHASGRGCQTDGGERLW